MPKKKTIRNRLTLQERWAAIQASARAAGIASLDAEWLGAKHDYQFRCQHGHEWRQRGDSLKEAQSCRACQRIKTLEGRPHGDLMKSLLAGTEMVGRVRHDNLRVMQELARARSGVCLSTRYTQRSDRYDFRCAAGHEWETKGSVILAGSWCRQCDSQEKSISARLADGLERLRAQAQTKGGECLSNEYLGLRERYLFRCARGHEWEATGSHVMKNSWCRACFHDDMRLTIDHAHAVARARGGQCLSTHFVNCHAKLRWLCDRGHEWQAAFAPVRKSSWCPQCASMARISNRKSKARRLYNDAGARLLGKDFLSEPVKG